MAYIFTVDDWCNWLVSRAKARDAYWYGVYFQKASEKILKHKREQYPAHYTDGRIATYKKHIAEGKMCSDCVNGAIKGAIWSNLGARESKYASNGCPDVSADGMFELCQNRGMPWGKIGTIPADRRGVAVRMKGHVGVCVGGDKVVEWRGFNYGCIVTDLECRPWTHWYKIPWCDYGEPAEAAPEGDTAPLTRLLKRGRTGEDVARMQRLLLKHGMLLPKYGADGDFGAETLAAVLTFQAHAGLEEDGVVGPLTWAKLTDPPGTSAVM